MMVGAIIQSGVISLVALALSLGVKVKVNWKLFALAMLLYIVYSGILIYGNNIQHILNLQLNWNWSGKLLGFVSVLGLTLVLSKTTKLQLSELGLTLKQQKNSSLPCILIVVFFSLLCWVASLGEESKCSVETALFQASLPGLDEELFYRGLLLYLLNKAISEKPSIIFGAGFGWACFLVTLLFSIMHGVHYYGELVINIEYIIYTFIYGFIFMWLRQRSGSLLMSIVAHNVFNLVINCI